MQMATNGKQCGGRVLADAQVPMARSPVQRCAQPLALLFANSRRALALAAGSVKAMRFDEQPTSVYTSNR